MIVCTCDLEGIEDLGPGLPVSAYKALQAQCLAHGARLEAGAVRMSGSTEWRTPPEFFAKLQAEFGFNVDAASTAENALVGKWCDQGRLCESEHHAAYGHGRFL